MSFTFIDVGIAENLVSSACYDKQQVCAYESSSVFTLDVIALK